MRHEILTLENVDIDNVIKNFINYFHPLGRFTDITGSINVFVFEEYYFRIESNLAVTIIFEHKDYNTLAIHAIVAGGSHGVFGFSWGAEKSMLNKIRKFFLGERV
jgi:hypothetical protein